MCRIYKILENRFLHILYNKITEYSENYKKCEWGVYDEMPSMDYVLSICDAYYGDGSSVVWLCQNQKIPVMIQNPCIK